jgi:hypothetical protein
MSVSDIGQDAVGVWRRCEGKKERVSEYELLPKKKKTSSFQESQDSYTQEHAQSTGCTGESCPSPWTMNG